MNRIQIKLVILSIILFAKASVFGQVENEYNWQVSYYGDLLINPGLQVGYQAPFKKWEQNKKRNEKEINKSKSYSWGADVIYYRRPKHHHGIVLSPNISFQKTNQKGKFFQIKFGLGYHRSFVDGTTYTVDGNGKVEAKRLVGQNTIFNSLSFDFGKDLRVTKNKPFRYFIQIGLNGRFPHNKAYLPNIHTAFGIHYFFKFNEK